MINKKDLYQWCLYTVEQLKEMKTKIPFRIVADTREMGLLMARELVEDIKRANEEERKIRAIIPCGPSCWYKPFEDMVNEERVSLKNLIVFHMDECLDWEGKLLAENDPYNFKTFMLKHFYGGISEELAVPEEQRYFLEPANMEMIREKIWEAPIDVTIGGWGQDGHLAYNQARRHPYSEITIEQLREASIRIQDNNIDTIIALGQRSFGAAYQFVPPMSITLGIKECLSAKQIRVYSDTGTWKQTALRVALCSDITTEYPMTLIQEHPNAIITATYDTASHPISERPDWEFRGINA